MSEFTQVLPDPVPNNANHASYLQNKMACLFLSLTKGEKIHNTK
jgi:hypothetical protein